MIADPPVVAVGVAAAVEIAVAAVTETGVVVANAIIAKTTEKFKTLEVLSQALVDKLSCHHSNLADKYYFQRFPKSDKIISI
jgi:hypothetical protein